MRLYSSNASKFQGNAFLLIAVKTKDLSRNFHILSLRKQNELQVISTALNDRHLEIHYLTTPHPLPRHARTIQDKFSCSITQLSYLLETGCFTYYAESP